MKLEAPFHNRRIPQHIERSSPAIHTQPVRRNVAKKTMQINKNFYSDASESNTRARTHTHTYRRGERERACLDGGSPGNVGKRGPAQLGKNGWVGHC